MPQPDTIHFDVEDYRTDVPLLCVGCLRAFSNAANCVRVAHNRQQGISKTCLGSQLVFPHGRSLLWEEGQQIPVGYEFITEIVKVMGVSASFTNQGGTPLPLFAVTMKDGSAYCALCAIY